MKSFGGFTGKFFRDRLLSERNREAERFFREISENPKASGESKNFEKERFYANIDKKSDAGELAAALNNKKILDNLRDGIPYPYTEKDAEEFIFSTLGAEKDSQYSRAITADGKVIGSVGVFRKDNIHRRTAEIGYYIAEEYWGLGIMTEVVRKICGYVFENTDIIRIFAEPFSYNTASCRVLEKAGFEFEGTLRKNAEKNGKILDMKMYSLIKKSPMSPASKAAGSIQTFSGGPNP